MSKGLATLPPQLWIVHTPRQNKQCLNNSTIMIQLNIRSPTDNSQSVWVNVEFSRISEKILCCRNTVIECCWKRCLWCKPVTTNNENYNRIYVCNSFFPQMLPIINQCMDNNDKITYSTDTTTDFVSLHSFRTAPAAVSTKCRIQE